MSSGQVAYPSRSSLVVCWPLTVPWGPSHLTRGPPGSPAGAGWRKELFQFPLALRGSPSGAGCTCTWPSCHHACGWEGRLPLKGQEQPSLQYRAGGADCLGRVLVLRGRRRLGLSTPPSSSRAAQADHGCSTPLRRCVLPWGGRLGVSGRHRADWTHAPQSPSPPILTWGRHLRLLLWG